MRGSSVSFVALCVEHCVCYRYRPPLFWGKSGHVQTVLYAKFGRFSVSLPSGQRTTKLLPDGSTLTFDIYQPTGKCQPVGRSDRHHCFTSDVIPKTGNFCFNFVTDIFSMKVD